MLASVKSTVRLLHPGLGLKRWLILLLIGLILLSLGIGLFLRELYAEVTYPAVLRLLLLQSLPRGWRVIIFAAIGAGLAGYSLFQLNKLMLEAFLPDQADMGYIAEQVYRHRRRRRGGPKVVVIGGGTGLSVLLSGLKHHTENITAIVTVADDGGSSGKLRRELGVLPPGDFRNCIAALADDEALTTQLFQYRFRSGGLEGHSFGNLFITAMAGVTGSFEEGLYQSGRVLKIRGSILPSTLANVTLFAEVNAGPQTRTIQGESAIPEANAPIERVYFEPDSPPAFPPAVQAILNADVIVAGPGSLYTSVIPNLLVAEITAAIRASHAKKIFICNVANQPGETDGYTLSDYVQAIEAHTQTGPSPATPNPLFDYILANNNLSCPIPKAMSHLTAVLPAVPPGSKYQVIGADVVDEAHPWRHNSTKLANQLMVWFKNNQLS
ncbi:MAG: Gluconeogenesis factor [Anaerolineae bacterium]|nr:Gluconeogenesis factor [Anaerolineae bacterium]